MKNPQRFFATFLAGIATSCTAASAPVEAFDEDGLTCTVPDAAVISACNAGDVMVASVEAPGASKLRAFAATVPASAQAVLQSVGGSPEGACQILDQDDGFRADYGIAVQPIGGADKKLSGSVAGTSTVICAATCNNCEGTPNPTLKLEPTLRYTSLALTPTTGSCGTAATFETFERSIVPIESCAAQWRTYVDTLTGPANLHVFATPEQICDRWEHSVHELPLGRWHRKVYIVAANGVPFHDTESSFDVTLANTGMGWKLNFTNVTVVGDQSEFRCPCSTCGDLFLPLVDFQLAADQFGWLPTYGSCQ